MPYVVIYYFHMCHGTTDINTYANKQDSLLVQLIQKKTGMDFCTEKKLHHVCLCARIFAVLNMNQHVNTQVQLATHSYRRQNYRIEAPYGQYDSSVNATGS